MNYHNITYPDMNNGSGLRVVLWCSACSHHCVGCENPQTWDANSGIPFDEKAEEELFRELSKDYISGLTLTGGAPLHENNLDDVLRIVNKIRLLFPEKTIWLYTGYTWEIIMDYKTEFSNKNFLKVPNDEILYDYHMFQRKEIIKSVDVVIDGCYIDSQRNLSKKWAGSDNQRVIDIKKSLQQNEVVIYCD